MALGISYRLQAYIEPLAFLAVAFYGILLPSFTLSSPTTQLSLTKTPSLPPHPPRNPNPPPLSHNPPLQTNSQLKNLLKNMVTHM